MTLRRKPTADDAARGGGGGSRAVIVGLAIALPLLSIVLAHVLFVPVYRSNDDIGMNMLAAGVGYTSEPTPYLMFSHHLLGRLLNGLYRLAPETPWYRLFGLAVQLASGVILAFLALRRRPLGSAVFLLLAYFLTFDLLATVLPHFTLSSTLAAQAALLLWYDRLTRGSSLSVPFVVSFLLLFGVSALIRGQGAMLMLVLGAPAVALHALRASPAGRGRSVARTLGLWAVTALLVAGLGQHDRRKYASDPGWSDFNETAVHLGPLIDFGRGAVDPRERRLQDPGGQGFLVERTYADEVYAVAREQAEWSPNDYHMMMEWFFADPVVYSADKLERVLAALPRGSDAGSAALRSLGEDPHKLVLLFTVLLALTFVPRAERTAIGLTALTVLALSCFLVFGLDRFPSWVYQPLLGFLCCLALIRMDRQAVRGPVRDPRFWLRLIALGVMVGSLAASLGLLHRESRTAAGMSQSLRAAMTELDPGPDELYVLWAAEFPWQWIRPADDLSMFRGLRIYSVGADTRGPFNRAQLESFGITDIYRAIYSRDDVRVISGARLNRLFSTYVAEHYGESVLPVEETRYSAGETPLLQVFRFAVVDGDR